MPDLARDTFTDTAYTVLTSHAEEVNGAAWSGFPLSNSCLISAVGRVFRSGYNPSNGLPDQVYGADSMLGYTPPGDDYTVYAEVTYLGDYLTPGADTNGWPIDFPDDALAPGRLASNPATDDEIKPPEGPPGGGGGTPLPNAGATLVNGRWINLNGVNNNPASGSNHRVFIYARVQASNKSHCYTFGYETTGSRYVLCRDQTDILDDGPTFTDWNYTVAAPAWAVDETRSFEIEVIGTTINARVNGVTIFSVTESDYASGTTGFEFKGGSSPVRGFHLDNYKINGYPPTTTTMIVRDKLQFIPKITQGLG